MRRMKSTTILCIAIGAFACGMAIGHMTCTKTDTNDSATMDDLVTPRKRSAIRDADAHLLRKRIRELERQLNSMKAAQQADTRLAQNTGQTSNDSPTEQAIDRNAPTQPPTAADMKARMEELRKSNPQRYAQMTNRFARMRSWRRNRTQNQLDILDSVDLTRLSRSEREVHDQYQEAVSRREELREMLNPQNEDIPEEQRRELFNEMRELDRLTMELAESERNTLLMQAARDLGATGQEASDFIETISAIYEATQVRGGPRPPRGGPPRP